MTGVVAFSLFGVDEDDVYFRGAIRNAEMYAELRPEWKLKFYVGKSVPRRVTYLIEEVGNSEIIRMDLAEERSATYWRFLAIRKGGYDFYLSRDVDSRPYARENAAVDEWLESPYDFHVMRDHPRHGAPMLAGMWGVKETGARKLRRRLPTHLRGNHYQVDQDFLKSRVWNLAKKNVMAHVGCQWGFSTETFPFTVPRKGYDYVAECYNGDDTLRFPDHRLEVMAHGYREKD